MGKTSHTCPEQIRRVVCLGGGTAMPKAVLEGLKEYPVNLSVISAVLDSGGSAGRLRKGFGTKISFGDIRRAVLVLSEADSETKNYFASRDTEGNVMANVFSTAMAAATGSPVTAISRLKERLDFPSRHEVLPATLDEAELCAVLENGKVIEGETNIDIPKHKGTLKIKQVFLRPKARDYPKALKAIEKADLIVIGPGDLYSSLAQILLVEGMVKAINQSRAQKVFICNLMTKYGETNNFTILDFTNKIEDFLARPLDFIIYNDKEPSPESLRSYQKSHPELLGLVKQPTKELLSLGSLTSSPRFIGADLLKADLIEHDPQKLSQILFSLLL